jgi:hypothetical protein
MKTQNTTTGAGNTTAAQPIDAAHAIYCDHDYNTGPLVCYVHDISEAALMAEALGENPLDVRHALDMRATLAAKRPIAVGTCYTTADENGVAVIGAQVTWSDGESGEMTWPNTDAFSAFQGRYYRF